LDPRTIRTRLASDQHDAGFYPGVSSRVSEDSLRNFASGIEGQRKDDDSMKARVAFSTLLLLLLLGLVACVPSEAISTAVQAEPSGTQSGITTAAPADMVTATQVLPDAQATPKEVQQEKDSDQLLVVPTLAPTATPGMIYTAVQQAVEATNLEKARFLGLSVADWINLAISLLLVFITLTLIARVIFSILKKSPGGLRRLMTRYTLIRSSPTCGGYLACLSCILQPRACSSSARRLNSGLRRSTMG
jgi:disulfide bond formation protein DsbB